MLPNAKASEQLQLLAAINPQQASAGTLTTSWISVAQANRLLAIIQTGVLGASATVDAKLQQATDSSGTGAKDISGKAITQLVKASNDNNQAMIDCRDAEFDINNGFTWVRLSLTVGTASSFVSALLLGGVLDYMPATQPTSVASVTG